MMRNLRGKGGHVILKGEGVRSGRQPLRSTTAKSGTAKNGESTHRRFITIAFAAVVAAVTAVAPFDAAHGQSISKAEVAKTTTASEPDQAKFKVTITGKDFGSDKSKITVMVSPQETLKGPPTVDDVKDGMVLNASFTAPSTYDLCTVTVAVGGHSSDPYLLTSQAGETSKSTAKACLPSISKAEVSKTTTTSKPDQATFKMTITGMNFGSDKSRITVMVSPQETLKGPPAVDDVKGGTTVNSSFTAPSTYALSTVTVTVGGHPSDPYVLPNVLPSQASGKPNQKKFIRVYRALLDPKVVADIFGKRIAQRFVVLQVTVANKNDDYQYLIHDLTLDLKAIMPPPPPGGKSYEASSADLSLLRGVAEKGQSMDGRNLTLRILRGAGSVAAGLIGVTTFGSSYAPSVAVFNGPAIAAVAEIFPDYTIGQMNRLSDSAYSANAIVLKQQSKVVAIFLPQAIFLNQGQRKKFWNDPTTLWTGPGCQKPKDSETDSEPEADSETETDSERAKRARRCPDLRYLEVLVDGDFITTVPDQALAPKSPATSPPTGATPGAKAPGATGGAEGTNATGGTGGTATRGDGTGGTTGGTGKATPASVVTKTKTSKTKGNPTPPK